VIDTEVYGVVPNAMKDHRGPPWSYLYWTTVVQRGPSRVGQAPWILFDQ
ncbi:hypothetical protein O988_06284, partial [Pseudogymnoascus sp. VKM F-3808]